MAFATMSPAPERNGRERLRVSNTYPATVGATERRVIREKLLIPIAVAVSLGSTKTVAKDCRMVTCWLMPRALVVTSTIKCFFSYLFIMSIIARGNW
jgi:hypothetical protein